MKGNSDMKEYYEAELEKINANSEVITIKVYDFQGNETRYFSLNHEDALKAMKKLIKNIEKSQNLIKR